MIKRIISSIITFTLTVFMSSSNIATENIENNNINSIDNNEEVVVNYSYDNLNCKDDKNDEEDYTSTTDSISEPLNDTDCEIDTVQIVDSVEDYTSDCIDIDNNEYIDNDYDDYEEEDYEDEEEEALLDYAFDHLDEYEHWWDEHEDEGYSMLYIVIDGEVHSMRFCLLASPYEVDPRGSIGPVQPVIPKEIDWNDYIEDEISEEEDIIDECDDTYEEFDITIDNIED